MAIAKSSSQPALIELIRGCEGERSNNNIRAPGRCPWVFAIGRPRPVRGADAGPLPLHALAYGYVEPAQRRGPGATVTGVVQMIGEIGYFHLRTTAV